MPLHTMHPVKKIPATPLLHRDISTRYVHTLYVCFPTTPKAFLFRRSFPRLFATNFVVPTKWQLSFSDTYIILFTNFLTSRDGYISVSDLRIIGPTERNNMLGCPWRPVTSYTWRVLVCPVRLLRLGINGDWESMGQSANSGLPRKQCLSDWKQYQ